MKSLRAFILAAGRGERLIPITNHIPKPLLPIAGTPIIENVLDRLFKLSINRIGINTHYLHEMIHQWAEHYSGKAALTLFHEDPVLGTGGAIKNAAGFLRDSVFIVHNSDVLSDLPLERLIETHMRLGNIATLAVHDYPQFNNVEIDSSGTVSAVFDKPRHSASAGRCLAFTGIAVYSQKIIEFLPDGVSSIVDAWLRATAAGYPIGTMDFSGCYWTDIGTPESYAETVFESLRQQGEVIYCDSSVNCSEIEAGANSVIEGGSLVKGPAIIERSIVLKGCHIEPGSCIRNNIAGPDYHLPLKASGIEVPAEFMGGIASFFQKNLQNAVSLTPAGTGGSDRNYYRIACGDSSIIMMQCPASSPDYDRHIQLTQLFSSHAVPVPRLYSSGSIAPEFFQLIHGRSAQDMAEDFRYAFFEDLGDLSLYSWLKCGKKPDRIARMYQRVMDMIMPLHASVTAHASECPSLVSRVFDYDHLRWETSYFLERFVLGIHGIDARDNGRLDSELEHLARSADALRKTIVHRDFQSQNILITGNDTPRLIDYQGARIGPPEYDLASILWDPYYRLDDVLRRQMLSHYRTKILDSSDALPTSKEADHALLLCRLQRHMQALGAYGFLSAVKGKSYFLKYIPQAMRYLAEEAGLVRGVYPELHSLVKKIHEKTAC